MKYPKKISVRRVIVDASELNFVVMQLKKHHNDEDFNRVVNYLHDITISTMLTYCSHLRGSDYNDLYNFCISHLYSIIKKYDSTKGGFTNYYMFIIKRKLKTYLSVDIGNSSSKYFCKKRFNDFEYNNCLRLDAKVDGDDSSTNSDIIGFADKNKDKFYASDWIDYALDVISGYLTKVELEALNYYLTYSVKQNSIAGECLFAKDKYDTQNARRKSLDNALERVRHKLRDHKGEIWPLIKKG